MYHTIVVILLSGILSATCVAQEQATAASPKVLTDAEAATPNSKAIFLIIDAEAQQSEIVRQVVEALEKAGIATGKAAETTSPANSSIRVTLRMRRDESYEKIKLLVEALRNAGVQQISLREGGSLHEGKEQNLLDVEVGPGDLPEFRKIESAAQAVQAQCGLTVLVESSFGPGKLEIRRTQDVANLSSSDSSEKADPAMDSASSHDASEIADLRTKYEAANKRVHDLAESLRQTPDTAKKSELRTAVQRAFTLRQSLLRAELQEMQARLEKTQQSLDSRDRTADQIVDRRVEDLLNPELKWEGSPQFAPAESAHTVVSGSSNPPAPIGLGIPEEIAAGAWGEPQNGLRLAIVVKSENSLWDKAQEVQYVVENVSKAKIALRGQRNDQLATLFEVRQTSQAQVQTMPRVNSGVQETGSDIELGPGERAVIGRVWMGAVEKQTDAIPEGDPQLLIIDSNAWEFRNKIYVVRGCLQPDPDQPTVTIRSGQVAIAFHKPAGTSIGSLPTSSPAMPVGEDKRLDSKESLLSALQGGWDLQSHTNPGDPPDPKIKHLDVEIKGNLMTLWISTDTQRIQAWSAVLKLGEPGPPQQIDMTFDPNDGEDRMETFGLIEITDDLVRICLDHSSESQRPEVFAVGQRSEIWELRRKTETTDPQALLLAKLQGAWDMQMQEADPNPPGGKEEAVIEGDLMTITITLDGETVTIPVQLKLDGSPETYAATMDGKPIVLRRQPESWPSDLPQRIDLIHFPNDKQEREVLPGIIEFREDSVRICMANSSSGERPEVFVVGKDANVWELRRPAPITELEGDWHRVAYIDKWATERRPINVTIRANQWKSTHWTGKSSSNPLSVDAESKTIDFGSRKAEKGNEIFSERGTYTLNGDILTIHSEYKRVDSVSSALISTGQHTNIWKRGLCKIEDYDSRNPGDGRGLFFLNGNDENTGQGKLIPGDKVDVLVSFTLPNETPVQRVLVERLEVDGSSEATENSQRQMRLVGTREQCLLLQNRTEQGTMALRTRDPMNDTLQFPNGINGDAFEELDAAAQIEAGVEPKVE